ncbi:MAG: HlyC/CorC family transporter [Erysipelotrichaceae bacterium]|jgi:CBS domain containing-hemolysin-like protein|nr:HlyC/CorC family transporter [Erysipelotrichaceae bacterium]MCR5095303.1 hemolysin family protein [Erysipelotrichaceae bacterium]
MNNSDILLILIFLVLCYSFFSASETAFSSLNKIKLKALANAGNKRAEKTYELTENFSKLLTTILIGNTIVNVVSASLATVLFTNLLGGNGVAVSSVVMTLVIMIIGEIIPKNIAKYAPEKFAMSATPLLRLLCWLFTPLTFVFEYLEKMIGNMFEKESDSYSTDEFITMVEEANEDGDIEDHEADLITNALEFNDLNVGDILTPRIDVIAIDINEDTIEEIELKYRDSGFSRLPVYDDSLDNIVGVLIEKDFYYHLLYEKSTNIKEILKEVIYTSPQVKISSLLKQLQTSKSHLAIVVDEYGGTQGIITMEDILEELVGEIYDEHDEVVEYYKKLDDNTYLVKADVDIEDMFEHFGIDNDEDYEFNTASAWVIDILDKIPVKGDSFDFMNMHVEVTDADSKKVNEIKIEFKKEDNDKKDK